MTGIYVHLPFCPYICPYCDFAKWPHRRSDAQRYLRALTAEISAEPAFQAGTLFFGGGTPNTYAAAEIAGLVRTLREKFAVAQEASIEINPELVAAGDLAQYVAAGIDRVSIGVQSLVPAEIETLGRKHTAADVRAAVDAARAAGVRSVSLDLMFAVPGQTPESWRHTLRAALELQPDHLSAYGLTVEEHTPYHAWQQREPEAFMDDSLEAQLYEIAIDELAAAGFEHYEISNFARPGHRCLHNANYWDNGEYRGFGVGAASYRGGERWVQTRSLNAYLDAVENGTAIPAERERLEGAARTGEAVMLALRTSQGVSFQRFRERYGVDFLRFYAPIVEELQEQGLLEIGAAAARLTKRGRFLANDVCGAFVTSA